MKTKLIKEILKNLEGVEPSEQDKSIMIRLTPQEILNISKTGAKYWERARNANTHLSAEEVCKFQVDIAIGILAETDPDRFEYNN